MSANDRCTEAAIILANGGEIPDTVRDSLIDLLEEAALGTNMYLGVTIARAINEANPDLHERVVRGELPGLYEAGS